MANICYQAGQVVGGIKAMVKALHNLAAHTDNKKVDNKLAAQQLNEVLALLSAFNPSEVVSTLQHLEEARHGLTGIFLAEDQGLPPILAAELNKQIAHIANCLFNLAAQIETLNKPE